MSRIIHTLSPLAVALAVITASLIAPLSAAAEANVTNTVLMVDQRGNLNVEGVASVEDVATNAVTAQIAVAKADAAQAAAYTVAESVQTVANNIMSNNVVIYRSGFSDAFAALVIFTDNDKFEICDARYQVSSSQIVAEIDYVSTVNLGTTKPIVYHHNTLIPADDFDELPESSVSTPVYHAEERVIQEQHFDGYYTITATIPNPTSTTSYFLWIKVEADAPAGDGTTLELPNGVTGGITGDFTWGDKILSFSGGVLRGVSDVE